MGLAATFLASFWLTTFSRELAGPVEDPHGLIGQVFLVSELGNEPIVSLPALPGGSSILFGHRCCLDSLQEPLGAFFDRSGYKLAISFP
jgi:hypothetical protein